MNFFSKALRRLTRTAGYTLTRCQKANGFPVDFSAEEIELVNFVRPYTLTTPERIHALHHAVRYLHDNGIGGDIVECGVWRGGSMMVAAKTLVSLGDTSRLLWLYDTFEGMTAPTEHDVSLKGAKATDKFQKRKTGDDSSDWCLAPQEEVAKNVQSTGYPGERMKFVKGKVEETLPGTMPDRIALLRLDTDWYESTLAEMTHLFPRLVPGGVLLIDDYGEWQGARKAVDEYVSKNQVPLLLNRVDSTGRMAVKLR
jgi:O-methyltransferase